MRKRRRYYDRRLDDAEVKDGEHVRVFLTDAQRQRRAIADAVARDARCWAGHRPGQIVDHFGPALTMDGAYSTAAAMRDQAFADLEQRSANAWRDGDAVVKVSRSEATPVRSALNVGGTRGTPLASGAVSRSKLPPVGENGDPDDDDNDNDNGNDNGDDLAEAQRQRDQAYSDQYRNERWRDPPSLYTPQPDTLRNYGGRIDPGNAPRYAMGPNAPSSGVLDPRPQSEIERKYEHMIGQGGRP
jgi:hypothetical protein